MRISRCSSANEVAVAICNVIALKQRHCNKKSSTVTNHVVQQHDNNNCSRFFTTSYGRTAASTLFLGRWFDEFVARLQSVTSSGTVKLPLAEAVVAGAGEGEMATLDGGLGRATSSDVPPGQVFAVDHALS